MKVIIPSSAIQAGLVTGGFVYIVVNMVGEITGLFVSKIVLGTSMLAGGASEIICGSIAGSIAASTVQSLGDGYFVPAVKVGSKWTSLGISLGVGLAAAAVVTLAYQAGQAGYYLIKHTDNYTSCDFTLLEEGEFNVLTLEGDKN